MKKKIFIILFLIFGMVMWVIPSFVFAINTNTGSYSESAALEADRKVDTAIEETKRETAAQKKALEDYEAQREKTVPTIIPKPKNLPGVTVETQKTSSVIDTVLFTMLPAALNVLLGFVAITSTIALLISGIMFLTAYGNDEQIGTAKKTATYAIVGLLLTIFSFAIVKIINLLPLG